LRVRGVILDVDGTLYDQSAVRWHVAMRLLQFLVRHPREGWRVIRVIQAYRDAQEQLRESSDGNVASRQIEIAAQRSGQSRELIEGAVARWMEDAPLDAVGRARFPGVVEFCRWARQSNLRLGVVSDYPAHAKLKALELSSYVSVVVSGRDADVNSFKPNPTGLLKALGRMHVDPDEAIYVGDRPDVDVSTAAAAGVRAVLFGHKGQAPINVTSLPTWPALQAWVAAHV
jgi:HAD superfamily hydrolase (TIGR01549 family)